MNTTKFHLMLFFLFLSMGANVFAKNYEIPPSSSTSTNVPYISDEAMEQCVKDYNEAKWLAEKINKTNINRYSQSSVNDYNAKVARHSKMTADFNRNCAGKQSESAYRAAQKLNQQRNK